MIQGDEYSQAISIPTSQSRDIDGETFSTEALYKRILADKLSTKSFVGYLQRCVILSWTRKNNLVT
jgi:hypothetical protein